MTAMNFSVLNLVLLLASCLAWSEPAIPERQLGQSEYAVNIQCDIRLKNIVFSIFTSLDKVRNIHILYNVSRDGVVTQYKVDESNAANSDRWLIEVDCDIQADDVISTQVKLKQSSVLYCTDVVSTVVEREFVLSAADQPASASSLSRVQRQATDFNITEPTQQQIEFITNCTSYYQSTITDGSITVFCYNLWRNGTREFLSTQPTTTTTTPLTTSSPPTTPSPPTTTPTTQRATSTVVDDGSSADSIRPSGFVSCILAFISVHAAVW